MKNKIFRAFSGIVVTGGLLLAFNASPASAATVVKFTNHTNYNITTSNGVIAPGHTQSGFDRRSDWFKTGSHHFYVGALGGGGKRTVCLPTGSGNGNTRYNIGRGTGEVNDGPANNVVAKPC